MDIVAYSSKPMCEQRKLVAVLSEALQESPTFAHARQKQRLISLPTGDGAALVFFGDPESPVRCALELSQQLRGHPELKLRMGIHTGPVYRVTDINANQNVSGGGINVAQRVMDCGDEGHILVSGVAADTLLQLGKWDQCLQDLGETQVKHGLRVHIYNLRTGECGNAELPQKMKSVPSGSPSSQKPSSQMPTPTTTVPSRELTSLTTTIAVLPLENVGADAENEYFSDGLTDELISALGQVSGLSVASRASAFAFKGKGKDLREIGESLHVETALEGSVRRAGSKVRVSIQLSDTKTGFQIWAGRFDREMRDVFELQDELAGATVVAIREKLARKLEVPRRASAHRPPNADAYDTYLKGRFHWNQKNIEGVQLAGRYFEEALQLDESFADAHAGLADYYSLLGSFGIMPPHEAWPQARASAVHAISLDPDLPEAHLALASVLHFYDWDWGGARKEIEKALALRPERGESYVLYVYHLMTQGYLEQALTQTLRGLKYDPLSASLLSTQAALHTWLGKHESGVLLAREALKVGPHWELYYALGSACLACGRTQEAVDALQEGLDRSRMPLLLGWLAEAHIKNGDAARAEAVLNQLLDHANHGSPMPASIAVAATALGKYDLAFEWLERAADARDILVCYLNVMPSWQILRKDPRFHQLSKRMKLTSDIGIQE